MDERELAELLDRGLDDLARGTKPRSTIDPITAAIAKRYLELGRQPIPGEADARLRAGIRARSFAIDEVPPDQPVFSANGHRPGRVLRVEPHASGRRAWMELAAAILLIVAIAVGPLSNRGLWTRFQANWIAAPTPSFDVGAFRGNAGRTGEMPGPGPTGMPFEQWRIALPGAGATVAQSAALVSENLVIVAQPNGIVAAFHRTSGEQIWKWQSKPTLRLVAAPAIDDGLLFVPAQDGTLVALDVATGTEQWRVGLGSAPGAPAAVDGTVYAGLDGEPAVANGVVYVAGGCACNAVVALDAATGAERWRFSPGDELLHALDAATGEERWRFDPDGAALADPSVASGLLYTVSSAGQLIALDSVSGVERWRQAVPGANGVGGFETPPAVSDGIVVVAGRNGSVTAFDATSGEPRWQAKLAGTIVGSPTVADGVVYIGDLNGTLTALGLADGAVRWSTKLSGLIGGPAAVTDGAIFLLTGDGALVSLADKR